MKQKEVIRYSDFCKMREEIELPFSYAYDSDFRQLKQAAFRRAYKFGEEPFHQTYVKMNDQ